LVSRPGFRRQVLSVVAKSFPSLGVSNHQSIRIIRFYFFSSMVCYIQKIFFKPGHPTGIRHPVHVARQLETITEVEFDTA
jgi:hypothetical protein